MPALLPIFDLDGTLLDSDAALYGAFAACGVARSAVTFGHVPSEECRRLGIDFEAFLGAYDTAAALPFPGVGSLLAGLGTWAMCSNKAARSGRAELARLGWAPRVALFSEDFGGPKRLDLVLAALALAPERAIFIGDTDHDRLCAEAAGVPFALAAWNPRASAARSDAVLARPSDLAALLG